MKFMCCLFLTLLSFNSIADTLVVLNKFDSTAALVDLETHKVLARLKTGTGPHEVSISKDGKTAVVTNYGDSTPGSTLTVIDIPSAKIDSTISLGQYTRPHGISWITDSEVLVTAEDQKVVLRVDVKKNKTSSISTEQDIAHMLTINSRADRAYVANIKSNSISVIDLNKNLKTKDILTGKGSEGIDFNQVTNEIWVTNRSDNTVSIVDSKSLRIKEVVETSGFPIRVKFTPDYNLALVTNAQSGELTVLDVTTKKLVKKIKFPNGSKDTAGRMFGDRFKDSSVPIGIAIDPKRNHAFIAHANLDEISILDLKTLNIIGKIVTGKEPDGMAYSKLNTLKR
jgi:DNA-binding beta-propeller fold protein YncE